MQELIFLSSFCSTTYQNYFFSTRNVAGEVFNWGSLHVIGVISTDVTVTGYKCVCVAMAQCQTD